MYVHTRCCSWPMMVRLPSDESHAAALDFSNSHLLTRPCRYTRWSSSTYHRQQTDENSVMFWR